MYFINCGLYILLVCLLKPEIPKPSAYPKPRRSSLPHGLGGPATQTERFSPIATLTCFYWSSPPSFPLSDKVSLCSDWTENLILYTHKCLHCSKLSLKRNTGPLMHDSSKREKHRSITPVNGPKNHIGKFLPDDHLLSFLLGTCKSSPTWGDNNSKWYTKSWYRHFAVSQPFWWILIVAEVLHAPHIRWVQGFI